MSNSCAAKKRAKNIRLAIVFTSISPSSMNVRSADSTHIKRRNAAKDIKPRRYFFDMGHQEAQKHKRRRNIYLCFLCLMVAKLALWLWAADSEFAHPVVERGAVHAEAGGGAGWTADDPLRVPKDLENVIALDGLEGGASVALGHGSC